jgi:hypothetical protein
VSDVLGDVPVTISPLASRKVGPCAVGTGLPPPMVYPFDSDAGCYEVQNLHLSARIAHMLTT